MLDNSELKQLAALLGDALSPRIREAVAENVNVRLLAQRQALAEEHTAAIKQLQESMSVQFLEMLASVRTDFADGFLEHQNRIDEELAKTREQVTSVGIENDARFEKAGQDYIVFSAGIEKLQTEVQEVKASIPEPVEAVVLETIEMPIVPPMLQNGELSEEMRGVMDVVMKQIVVPILQSSIAPVNEAIETAKAESAERDAANYTQIGEAMAVHVRSIEEVRMQLDATLDLRGIVGQIDKRVEDVSKHVSEVASSVEKEVDERTKELISDNKVERLLKEAEQNVERRITEGNAKLSAVLKSTSGTYASQLKAHAVAVKAMVDEAGTAIEQRLTEFKTSIASTSELSETLEAQLGTEIKLVRGAIDEVRSDLAQRIDNNRGLFDEIFDALASGIAKTEKDFASSVESVSQEARVNIEALREAIASHGRTYDEALAQRVEELSKSVSERITAVTEKFGGFAMDIETVKKEMQGLGTEFETSRAKTLESLEALTKDIGEVDIAINELGTAQADLSSHFGKTVSESTSNVLEAARTETQELIDKVSKAVSEVSGEIASLGENQKQLASSIESLSAEVPKQIDDRVEAVVKTTTESREIILAHMEEAIKELKSADSATEKRFQALLDLTGALDDLKKQASEQVAQVRNEVQAAQNSIDALREETDASVTLITKKAMEHASTSAAHVEQSLSQHIAEAVAAGTLQIEAVSMGLKTIEEANSALATSLGLQIEDGWNKSVLLVKNAQTTFDEAIAEAATAVQVRIESVATGLKEIEDVRQALAEELSAVREFSESTHTEIRKEIQDAIKVHSLSTEAALASTYESVTQYFATGEVVEAVRCAVEQLKKELVGVDKWRGDMAGAVSECRSFQGSIAQSFADVRATIAKVTEGYAKTDELQATQTAFMQTLAVVEERLVAEHNELQKEIVDGVKEAVDSTRGLATLSHLEAVRVSAVEAANDAAVTTARDAAHQIFDAAMPEFETVARATAATAGAAAAISALPEALQGHTEALGASLAPFIEARATQVAEKAARAAVGPLATQAAVDSVDALRAELKIELDPASAAAKAVADAVPALVKDNLSDQLAGIELRLLKELTANMQREVDRIPLPENGKDARVLPPVPYEPDKRYEHGVWVAHKGGIWVAARNTDSEPSESSPAWDCVTPGIRDIKTVLQEDGRTIEVQYELSNGNVHLSSITLPIPVERGVYDPEFLYYKHDVITFDGSQWTALRGGKLPRPKTIEESPAWGLRIKHGKDGKDLKQPEPAIIRYAGDGAHDWEPDVEYPVNKVVKHAGVFWLSMRSTRERPPFTLLVSNDTWLKLGA